MTYPNNVNANVDGFGVANGQDMEFDSTANPPAYDKDTPSEYTLCHLRRNSAGTNWDLIVVENTQIFVGHRTPAADDPVGNYEDTGTQTATVTEI